MSTMPEAAAEQQIANNTPPTNAEALEIQIDINDANDEQHQQNITLASSSPSIDNTTDNNTETNGESAPIPRPKKKTTVELTPAPTVSINVDSNEQDDYTSKKVEIANYTGNKYVHPGPMTSTLPKPPNTTNKTTNINNINNIKPSHCLCFELKHINTKAFKGNNYIVCNGLFLCGTDMCTYVTTWIFMNLPGVFFYWAQFAYLPQHGIAFFILCFVVSFTCNFICCIYLVRTNMTDPGILPRFTASEPMHGPFNQHDRFCKTCNIIRPIHAKHCRTCNNCVNGFDHHCPWTGTCVAERNIRYFVGFVSFAGLYGACAFLICISILINRPGMKELNPMVSVGIIIIAGYGLIMSCMLVSMGGSYMCMVGEQLTTNEKIKHGGRLMTDAEKLNNQTISGTQIYCDAFCRKLPESQIYE